MSKLIDAEILMRSLLASLALTGDVFTDAKEKSGPVCAAKNLRALASILGGKNPVVIASGVLFAEADEEIGPVNVLVDGTVVFSPANDFDGIGRICEVRIDGLSAPLEVNLHVTGDFSDDEHWCISNLDMPNLYCYLMTPPPVWNPVFAKWRHGGWYVSNVTYPSGASGCVSNNYPDKKWRIVCDDRRTMLSEPGDRFGMPGDFMYASRDAAARAEHALVEILKRAAAAKGEPA